MKNSIKHEINVISGLKITYLKGSLYMYTKYSDEEYCMNFTNEEIIKFFLNLLKRDLELNIRLSSSVGNEINENSNEKIMFVSFDGVKENFYIRFYEHQTSIFISDEEFNSSGEFTFNLEFMFIDDDAKVDYVSSDTHGNIVYEGTLRDKTHKEILELFCTVIKLLNKAESVSVEETFISQEGMQYSKYSYIVKILNDSGIKQNVQLENIKFIVNQ